MLAAALLLLLSLPSADQPLMAQVAPMSDVLPMEEPTNSEASRPSNEEAATDDTASPQSPPAVASWLNRPTVILLSVVLIALLVAAIVGRALRRQPENFINPALVRTFNKRVVAYWVMFLILGFGLILGEIPTVLLVALMSFWALREFVTMTPTRRGDHRALFWTFFILTPLQYVLVGLGSYPVELDLYAVYSILIPVYASLFIPARIAFAGDSKRFLERTAKIQAGLMICVYALSYAPAILFLKLQPSNAPSSYVGYWGYGNNSGSMAGLLFWFVLVAQLGDVFSYAWGKLLGRSVIAPAINGSKTWEGLIGGTLTTTLVGALLWWVTPFQIHEAGLMSAAIALMGFAGGMTMSAIKRDRGVRDYGTLVTGHAGVLDRIDSICFAAPVFYHLTRAIFSVE